MCVLRVRATTSPLGATRTAVLKPSPSSLPSGRPRARRARRARAPRTPRPPRGRRSTVGPSSSDSAVASGAPGGQRVGGVARQGELGEEDDAGARLGGGADAVEQGRAQPLRRRRPRRAGRGRPARGASGFVDAGERGGHLSGGDQAHAGQYAGGPGGSCDGIRSRHARLTVLGPRRGRVRRRLRALARRLHPHGRPRRSHGAGGARRRGCRHATSGSHCATRWTCPRTAVTASTSRRETEGCTVGPLG